MANEITTKGVLELAIQREIEAQQLYRELGEKMVEAAAAYDTADEEQKARLAEELDKAHKHVLDLYKEYEEGLPVT